MRTALIVPTRNSAPFLDHLLPALARQTLTPERILVVDSGSSDGSPERWRRHGAQVVGIDPAQFNHGGTRRWASEQVADADTLIYMTQDAVPASDDAFAQLCAGLHAAPEIGCAYGRQLPHAEAGVLASHARAFNYPATSRIKRLTDRAELGIKTCFSSDAFAAYRREALERVGGFPTDVIGSEDAYVAARLLLAGYAVHYVAEAVVRHSHDYTPMQEFRRYFDIGVFYRRERWIGESFGHAGGEGRRFVASELRALRDAGQSWRTPEVLWRSALKLAGYRLGHLEHRLPRALKRRIGMFPRYWDRTTP